MTTLEGRLEPLENELKVFLKTVLLLCLGQINCLCIMVSDFVFLSFNVWFLCFFFFFSFFLNSGLFCLPVCFPKKERKKGIELGGWENWEDLRGIGGGKTDQNILYEKTIFN